MTKPKWQGLKTMRPLYFVAFIFAALLPEVAWANYGPPPVASTAPKTLILLLPLMILFTELGGGYKILEAERSEKFEWWRKAKPLLAFLGICLPVLFQVWSVIGLVYLAFVIFCIFRGLRLIYYGLSKRFSRIPPQWSSQVKVSRLILAGLMILGTLIVLVIASGDAVTAGHNGRRAYDSDTKANLHNIYLACKAYWADSGSSKGCNDDVFTLTTYGYIQSSGVLLGDGGGHELNFSIMAKSKNSENAYKINSLGTITRKENKHGEDWEGNPVQTPSVFSKAYNLLVQFLTE